MAATYVVLRPDGNGGFARHATVSAINATQAVEISATEPGEYIAVVEDRLVPMRVEPVEAFKVVNGNADH